jgi:hypothetical protein
MSIQRLSNAGQSGFRYKSLIAGITPVASVPVIGEATAVTSSTASVTFTAPGAYAGSTYTATSSPGGLTGTSATSPIIVTGLSEQTAYTFTVTATNATGTSGPSAASNSITTPPAFTPEGGYDALASATISSSGSTAEVLFSSIPSGYKHLQLRVSAGNNTAGVYYVAVYNGDTNQANYPRHRLFGTGSSAGASATINTDSSNRGAMIGSPLYSTTQQGVAIVDILDYSNPNKNKTTRSLFGQDANGSGIIELHSSLWTSPSPINSINVRCNLAGGDAGTTTYNAGSVIALYGVK